MATIAGAGCDLSNHPLGKSRPAKGMVGGGSPDLIRVA
jgi:hypothetical protein